MIFTWPYQSTPYLSALPGVAGPGLDVSAGDLPSKLYFITSYDDTKEGGPDERGPNCYSGTLRYCWGADQGEGFHKYVIPLIGGYVHVGRVVLTPEGRGDMDYLGHAAPGAGLFVQTAALCLYGGSNMRVWHLPSWVGDKPSAPDCTNFHAGNRDALQAGAEGHFPSNCAFINCEARFSMDEAVQVYYAMDGVSWIRGAVYDPLHVPPDFGDDDIANHEPGADHGYGHIIGGAEIVDRSLVSQSLYAHTTDRNPLVSALNHSHINVLHYDHGRPEGGKGEALNVRDNENVCAGAGLTMQCNLVGCVSVRGPNNNDTLCFARTLNAIPEGSTGHAANNSVYGWPSPESQDEFFTSKPDDYMQPTLRRSAWPSGLGANYSGVLQPCAYPLNPTLQEGLAFAQLIRTTVGCKPASRWRYKGGVNTVMDQIDAALRGVASERTQWVNTVDEAGGWPEMPTLAVDPEKPGDEHHAPIPLGADRDEVCLSGTFADGTSKVGYTKLRAWAIDQYFYVMGR
jgi:hypothetical protein